MSETMRRAKVYHLTTLRRVTLTRWKRPQMTAKDRKGPQKTAPVVMVGVDGTKLLKPEEVAAITGLSIETLAQPAT